MGGMESGSEKWKYVCVSALCELYAIESKSMKESRVNRIAREWEILKRFC